MNKAENLFSGLPRKPLHRKPISRGAYECSRLCRVYELNLSNPEIFRISRGGVVYYTFHEEKLYFCFGKDRWTQDLTDFGGGRRGNENPIECAIREGNEESRFAFGNLSLQDVQWFWCLYNTQMLIIFVQVAAPLGENIFHLTLRNFESTNLVPNKYVQIKEGIIILSRCCDEVSEIVWLNEQMIENTFSEFSALKVYTRVRRFIRSCPQFRKPSKFIRNWLLEKEVYGSSQAVT